MQILVCTLTDHSDWIKAIAVTFNGKQVISASDDETVKVWNLETGEEQFTLLGHNGWLEKDVIAVNPNG